jgi:hypothetical protein
LAAFILTEGNKVIVLDLQSGDVRLTVDVGMRIICVGVTESMVAVAGRGKIVTWNVPVEDCAIHCTVNTTNSVNFVDSLAVHEMSNITGSISPDLSCLAVTGDHFCRGDQSFWRDGRYLSIYNAFTGEHLATTRWHVAPIPWFAPGGREVWVDSRQGWRIVQGGESDNVTLERLEETENPPRGFMGCESPCGYEVTDAGWLVNSKQERSLWLPHHWRSGQRNGKWGTRFLAFRQTGGPLIVLEFLK